MVWHSIAAMRERPIRHSALVWLTWHVATRDQTNKWKAEPRTTCPWLDHRWHRARTKSCPACTGPVRGSRLISKPNRTTNSTRPRCVVACFASCTIAAACSDGVTITDAQAVAVGQMDLDRDQMLNTALPPSSTLYVQVRGHWSARQPRAHTAHWSSLWVLFFKENCHGLVMHMELDEA
jgi:hypothetical protein